jgi:hypothetical protein
MKKILIFVEMIVIELPTYEKIFIVPTIGLLLQIQCTTKGVFSITCSSLGKTYMTK